MAARQVEGAVQGRTILLDFSACRQIDIAAAALLAQVIERGGGSVNVRGLTRDDCRLLAYVGVTLGGAESRVPQGSRSDDD
jgi:ABC-type transporter Mla MlaB component